MNNRKVVLWKCQICGNEWKGKSPQVRTTRPYCSECGSSDVRVKDWLIDKEKWNKARLNAFKRAGWRCEACGGNIHLSAPVHHLDYDDYYDSDSVVCLCSRCHHLNHGKAFCYKVGRIFKGIGIVGIIIGGYYVNDLRVSSWSSHRTLVMAIMGLFIGVVLIFLSRILTKKTREARRAIKEAVKNRTKIFEAELEKNERDDLDIDDELECLCQGCGREISEGDYWEFGGLCKRCRGMPLQQGFPSPPGFPKLS
ncbi:MAG: hypothetical protein ACFFCW_38335 [Candidatus Hodarchaeota archaeon]